MIRNELLRMLKSRIVWAALAMLAAYYTAMTVYVDRGIPSARSRDAQINEYLARFDGADTDELITAARAEAEALSEIVFAPENADRIYAEAGQYGETLFADFIIVSAAASRAEYLYREFPERMIETVNRAARAAGQSDGYTAKEQQKVISQYNRGRRFTLTSGSGAAIWTTVPGEYTFFNFFLLLAILVISADCFTCGHARNMSGMIFATRNGRLKLFLAKLSALSIAAFGIMLIITLVDVAGAAGYMGAANLGEPVQAIKALSGCPFSLTILGYILVLHLLTLLLMLVVIGISAAVCSLLKNGFAAVTAGSLITAAGVAAWIYAVLSSRGDALTAETYEWYERLRVWLPTCFLDGSRYFDKFDCINFLGAPTERLTVCVICSLAMLAATTAFAALRFGKPRGRKVELWN